MIYSVRGGVRKKIADVSKPQVQADWLQEDDSAFDFIKNKPELLVGPTGPPGVPGSAGPVGPPGSLVILDYDPATIYGVGSVCTVNGSIARCLVSNTTGAWNEAKWEFLSASPQDFSGPQSVDSGYLDFSTGNFFHASVLENTFFSVSGISGSVGQVKRLLIFFEVASSIHFPMEFQWPGNNIVEGMNPYPAGTKLYLEALPISSSEILVTNFLSWGSAV